MYTRKCAGKKSSLAGLLFLLLCGPGHSALAQQAPPEPEVVDVSGAVTLELTSDTGTEIIPALSWQFSSTSSFTLGDIAGGSASTNLNPIKIVRRMDDHSGGIMSDNWLNDFDELVTIRQGSLTIELKQVYVVSYIVDGASYGNEEAVEVFELDYVTIEFIFPGGMTSGWDRQTNESCSGDGCNPK